MKEKHDPKPLHELALKRAIALRKAAAWDDIVEWMSTIDDDMKDEEGKTVLGSDIRYGILSTSENIK